MQGNLRSITLQHSFEVETLDREKLAVGECILDHRGSSVRVLNGRIRRRPKAEGESKGVEEGMHHGGGPH